MNTPESWEPMQVALTTTNPETGVRETKLVQGELRRNPTLTPEERAKYVRFQQRRKAARQSDQRDSAA